MPSLADRRSIEAFLSAHENLVEPTLYERGQCIGSWRVMAFLGRGGSGEVYRVEHLQLGFAAAMKVLVCDDARSQDRFRREAAIFATSAHPAFPRFLGYGETDGRPYLVLELLADYKLPSSDKSVARYLRKVCEGVSHLHSLGLVHRDIKPANILCREKDGQPVLIDLGLVKDTALPTVHKGESLSLVKGKAVGVGTPKYAAPEQFSGGTISPTADVHALGMLANECFSGNPPRSWTRIIRRSTSSIPSQRYRSVEEFAGAIRRRHRVNVIVVATALVLLLALATAVQIGWLSAVSGRAPAVAVSGETSHQRRGGVLASPDERGLVIASTNKIFMVTDDEASPERKKKRIVYPQAGVFGGDKKIDPNF